MGNLSLFLKNNKIKRENYKFVASQLFRDENGNPVEWELRPITTKENELIKEDCTSEVPVKGKPHMFKPKLNYNKYVAKVIAASVVFPNLNDKELQDSYGVMSAEELVVEILDNPIEYNAMFERINTANGFDATLQDKVDQAKN